ncbi:MAG TPA: cadherin-like beta sandwich domain-containing protein [Candidatus Paenibacillus intestinavium]|nr:cadherin-like beta sandwich domain-containing protein [Candidatus Paenibacillus intestinavium]
MKQIQLRSRLSMLLVICMIVTSVSFIGGGKVEAAGSSFKHVINQTINVSDAPINETMSALDTSDLPQTIAHLLIYANDVDEVDGEWDLVTWNGTQIGMLSGQNNQNSTTVFTLDIADVQESNDFEIDVTNGLGSTTTWVLNAYWAQLVIDNGPVVDAEITSLNPVASDANKVTVGVDTRAIEAGDYYLEANLIDENGYNKGIYTKLFLNASEGEDFTGSFDVTGLPTGVYTANAILYNYDNSQTDPQDKIGTVQHIVTKTIDTTLLLNNVDFTPTGGPGGQVVLDPNPFNPYTYEYNAVVPYGIAELTQNPTLSAAIPVGAQLAVQVNGEGYNDITPGSTDDIPLEVGRNIINYKVYTGDNPEGVVYTIIIDRVPMLEELLSNPGTEIAPEFDGTTPNPLNGYRTTVSNPSDTIVLTPKLPATADANTTIELSVNGGAFEPTADAVNTDELPLHVGRNTIIVRVTSPDGIVYMEYPVYVDREPALASPGLSEGGEMLAPEFSSDVYEYTTVVGHTSTPITLTPTVNDGETIEVRVNSTNDADYVAVGSGITTNDLDLIAGTNTIEVRVKSSDYDAALAGTPAADKADLVKMYTFTVIRNPFVTDIVVKDQDLKVPFDANVLEHNTTKTVPYTQKHINVTPTTTDAPVKLEIRINDGDYAPINSGDLSDNLLIRSGRNKIDVKATSTNPKDGQEYSTVYTVYVNKGSAPSTDPISQLTPESGQNLLVTDIIGKELTLSANLLKADGTKLNNPTILVDAQGNYTLNNVPTGKYNMVLTVNGPSGQELAGHVANLSVDNQFVGKSDGKLIDPRSKVSDAATSKALEGVTVTLYWADSELNRSKGHKAGEAVNLPALNNFAPHKNNAVQTTLDNGIFGWVPFVDGDYYFIAEKDGYITFDSREDSRSGSFGEGSKISDGMIHIGKSLVTYNFSMKAEGTEVLTGTHAAYMTGYPDGTFKPERGLSRAELAAVLNRIIPIDTSVSTDVPKLNDLTKRFWASNTIDIALQQGWLKGYTDGTFKAEKFVTRAELAQVIYNIKASDWGLVSGNASFKDIEGHWGATAIKALASQGLITGDKNGNFRPNDAITRAEAVTIFNKLLGRNSVEISQSPRWSDVKQTYWAYQNIMEASITHEYEENTNGTEEWVK